MLSDLKYMPLKQIAYYNNIFFNRFTIIWNDFHNFRYRDRYRKTSDYSLFVRYKECIHFMNVRWVMQQWVSVHITFVDPKLPIKIFQAFLIMQTATQRCWNDMKRLCFHPHHDRNRNHLRYIAFSSQYCKVATCLKLPSLRKYRGDSLVFFFS